MENIADAVSRDTKVDIEIYGFDTGTGNPPPEDYRDVPFVWREGQFRIDEAELRRRLRRAKLLIGDVGQSVRNFTREYSMAPIGFIAFDMDYYSSTKRALPLLDEGHQYVCVPARGVRSRAGVGA
jgi:hypothetical protein